MSEPLSTSSHAAGRHGISSVVVRGGGAGFVQQVSAGVHCLTSDEPVEMGGTDTGPSPYDLLLAALGSCTSMTVAMYARRKGWPLEEVTVRLRHSKQAPLSPEGSATAPIDLIEREVQFVGTLTDEQRARLLEIANKCPIHRTLLSKIEIRTQAVSK